nr:beta-ketoacyl reductase [Amycolatopsis alba]
MRPATTSTAWALTSCPALFGGALQPWSAASGAWPGQPRSTCCARCSRGSRSRSHRTRSDVANASALRRVLQHLRADGRPIKGVIHVAMVLSDAELAELDETGIRAALAPKMHGAWSLDALTRDDPLDFFVSYSSMTATVGNAKQANYAAGNLALEALARAQRRAGRRCVAIGWGAIGETGYVVRNDLYGAVRHAGLKPVHPDEAFEVLDRNLTGDSPVLVAGRFDWNRLQRVLPIVSKPRFEAVNPDGSHDDVGPGSLRERIAAAAPEQALPLVADVVAEVIAKALQTDLGRLRRDRGLDQLGLDSLMAAEVVVAIRDRLAYNATTLEITNAAGITDLARHILDRMHSAQPTVPAPRAEPNAAYASQTPDFDPHVRGK